MNIYIRLKIFINFINRKTRVYNFLILLFFYTNIGGTPKRSWLRLYATSRKVADSIPDKVIGFFNLLNPANRTMTLGSTQPLTEISTRNLPGGKGRQERKADKLTAICEPIT
jgi:hypothetical protein